MGKTQIVPGNWTTSTVIGLLHTNKFGKDVSLKNETEI